MTARRWLILAVLAATSLVAAAGCGRVAGQEPVTLQITIHYSQFEETALTVPHGVPVTFVLINQDPIEHEWLIGDAAFHERHRTRDGGAPRRAAQRDLAEAARDGGDDADLRRARQPAVHLPSARPRGLRDGGDADRHLRLRRPAQAPIGGPRAGRAGCRRRRSRRCRPPLPSNRISTPERNQLRRVQRDFTTPIPNSTAAVATTEAQIATSTGSSTVRDHRHRRPEAEGSRP